MSWRDWWRKPPPPPIPTFEPGATFKGFMDKDLPVIMPVIPTPEEVSIKHGGRTRRVAACLTDIVAKLNDREWLHNNHTYQFCSVVYLQDDEAEVVINELRKAGWDVEWEYKLSAARHFFTLLPRRVG